MRRALEMGSWEQGPRHCSASVVFTQIQRRQYEFTESQSSEVINCMGTGQTSAHAANISHRGLVSCQGNPDEDKFLPYPVTLIFVRVTLMRDMQVPNS